MAQKTTHWIPRVHSAIVTNRLTQCRDGRVVFKHVDLKVAPGDCVAIVGDNGAGKTTLLRSLAGTLRPTSGTVAWYGHADGSSQHVRAMLGYVGHEPQVYPYLTVYENLLFAARMHAIAQPRHRVHELLTAMGISHLANDLAAKVSRGIRQRLDIARATIHEPSVLLLDEPLNSLDHRGRQWLMHLLASLQREQQTVCFTTHHGQSIRRLANRVFRIRAESVLEVSPDESDTWPAAA